MTTKSLLHSSLLDNLYYNSMLAGNEGFNPSAYDLLETVVLGSTAQTVTFTGLDSFTKYKHLQIRMSARSQRSAVNDYVQLVFNGDDNGYSHLLYGENSTVASLQTGTGNVMVAALRDAANYDTNAFGPVVIDILEFTSTSKFKTVRGFSSGGGRSYLASALWPNTAAITSVGVTGTLTGSSFSVGSRISLYGVK